MTQTAPRPKPPAGKKKRRTNREIMLADPDILRWYNNMAKRSRHTAEVRLRKLSRFCKLANTTPKKLVKLTKRDGKEATDIISDQIGRMEEYRHGPGHINGCLQAVRSWLNHFDATLTRKINVAPAGRSLKLEKRAPTLEEMADIYSHTNRRTGALVALLSGSGIRPQVAGNDNATDGLRLGDLPDIAIRNGRAEILRMPCKVVVRSELSKKRWQYFSLLGRFAAEKLVGYFNHRIKHGERLDGDSPVIAPHASYNTRRGANAGKAHISTAQVSKLVREAIVKAIGKDSGVRPYDMRAFFATQMLTAEARGKIAHDFHVFFMGHAGTMLDNYTTHKGILSDQLVGEMSKAFRRAEPLLEPAGMTAPKEPEGDNAKNDDASGGDGQDRDDGPGGRPGGGVVEVRRDDNRSKGPGGATVDVRPEGSWLPYGYVATRPQQRAVNADEAGRLINHGWRFVQELSNGLVIVEAPSISHDDNSMAA